jgi:hypothetical protein
MMNLFFRTVTMICLIPLLEPIAQACPVDIKLICNETKVSQELLKQFQAAKQLPVFNEFVAWLKGNPQPLHCRLEYNVLEKNGDACVRKRTELVNLSYDNEFFDKKKYKALEHQAAREEFVDQYEKRLALWKRHSVGSGGVPVISGVTHGKVGRYDIVNIPVDQVDEESLSLRRPVEINESELALRQHKPIVAQNEKLVRLEEKIRRLKRAQAFLDRKSKDSELIEYVQSVKIEDQDGKLGRMLEEAITSYARNGGPAYKPSQNSSTFIRYVLEKIGVDVVKNAPYLAHPENSAPGWDNHSPEFPQ